MQYIEDLFQGLIILGPVQKSEVEVLRSIRAAIIRDQKMPFETGISNTLADAARLINELCDELRNPDGTKKHLISSSPD